VALVLSVLFNGGEFVLSLPIAMGSNFSYAQADKARY
jgi:hypothetical protein